MFDPIPYWQHMADYTLRALEISDFYTRINTMEERNREARDLLSQQEWRLYITYMRTTQKA